ncbi:transposase [Cylindrospermum sp. NIES-4074]|nr:transposase [Cylindrospermum sp. NIES-4074]
MKKNVSPTLKVMHELKEEFRQLFEKTDSWLTALFKLGMWLSKAKKYFPDS